MILSLFLSLRFQVIFGFGLPFAEHVSPTWVPTFTSSWRRFRFEVKFHGARCTNKRNIYKIADIDYRFCIRLFVISLLWILNLKRNIRTYFVPNWFRINLTDIYSSIVFFDVSYDEVTVVSLIFGWIMIWLCHFLLVHG